MNTPAPTGNTPLLLKELDIPGRSPQPISSNPIVWGINWAAALGNFPLLGLLCRAGPWSTMNVGDRLVVNWGTGQQVVNKTIDKDEVDKTLTLFVPPGRLLDGPFKVSYVVTRLGQVAEPSEVMDVLVKLTIPGGQDTDPGPGHSNFFMFLPKGTVENGIDKDNVADGVDITIGPDPASGRAYLNAATGDVILVSWGGVFVPGPPLTQDQADGKAPIIIHVDEATIREAGDSDGVAVAFEVHDKVFNRSEDWSHEQRVPVAIDTTRPAAPLLKQAVSNVLDLDKLGNADGIAQVMILDNRIAVGDIITVRVKGATTEGVPIDEKMPAEPVVSVPSILEIEIPNVLLRRMAKSQLILSYAVQKRDGSPDLQARSQFISVIGEARRLLAPKAIEANQGALDPDLAQVRVEIPFDDSFAAGQVIVLFWLGTRPDLSIYLPDLPQHPITQGEIDAGRPIVIIVPGSHLRPINGGTLVLYYQLLTEDQKLREMNPFHALHAVRESLRAAPLQIGEPLQELPPPKVDGVVNGVLPADTPGTQLNMLYTQTVADDVVYRQWLGSKTGADSDWVKLTSLTAGKAVAFTIKPELIKGNEGGTVKASYHLERKDGRVSYSQIEEFNVGVKADLQAPRIKEAPDDAMLDPVAAKDKLTALVNYTGMAVNDVITVTFTGAAGTPTGGSHTAAPKTVSALGEQEIALVNSVLAFNLGKGVTVSYTVKQGSAAPIPSPSRPLVVAPLTLGPAYASKILQAANNGDGPELDVSAITTTVRTHSPNWPLIALKQYVWLRFRGTQSSGAAYDKFIFQPPGSVTNAGWVTGDYEYNVPAAVVNEIKGLKHGSSFTVEFKAGLSGTQQEADAVTFPVRTYTIKAVEDLKPAITRAEDSRGTEIAPGGITADPVVKLTGTAAKDQKVEVFDGTTSKGQATANASGIWELRMTALSVAAHTFRARALYGSNLESEARTLTVTALIAPTLVNVLDAAGTPVPEGGVTTSTTLKLSGKASNGQRVEIFDGNGSGAVSKGIATAHATTGDWEHTITVAAGARRLYAKSLYHSSDTYSNVRNLSVTAATAPTLTSVKGLPSNVEIPNGGITVEISAELSGTAAKGQKVEVFDGATSKGQATADATTGEWRLTVSALSVAAHSFTAKALYGSGAQSGARTFTVVAATAPTLTSVKGLPSNVEIPNGGITVEISAELSGTAAKGQKVEV
ncbi:hypothetical protein OC948_20105, partial [Pseudomonas koreensis]|nr:hypothetical protein [Pseudomonas koreensis]